MERRFDWNKIKDLKTLDWIPDRYDIEEQYLFRSPLLLLNHLFWNQLVDYKFYNQINSTGDPIITVHAYYTSAIYTLRRLKVVEIPANEPFKQTIQIKNTSPLRQNSIKQARLENCLATPNSRELRYYIESNYGLDSLEEYCKPEFESMEIKGDLSVTPYDRVWVAWALEMTVAIYREDTEGNISLVGCNDYLYSFVPMIYPKSNNYWTVRTMNESKANNNLLHSDLTHIAVRPQGNTPDSEIFNKIEKEEFDNWKKFSEDYEKTTVS